MAVQFHVANSNSVSGAAIFAGGPYYCAQELGLTLALTSCMKDPDLIVTDELVALAAGFATEGEIDSLDGLQDDVVLIYSGKLDTVVDPGVVKKTGDWYANLGARVVPVFNVSSEHCMPTDNYGNACSTLGSPFISKCGFDGAGAALNTLLSLSQPRGAAVAANFKTIDQSKFFPKLELVLGLDHTAYVYVPTNCQNGSTRCRLHMDFHGCNQEAASIGTVYVQHAGFAEWAETNNIIVLWPQAKSEPVINPKSCFDWWGYSSTEFPWKSAPQMETFQNMIDYLRNPSTVIP